MCVCVYIYIYSSFFGYVACKILIPWSGIEPRTTQWQQQFLTTGPPSSTEIAFPIEVRLHQSLTLSHKLLEGLPSTGYLQELPPNCPRGELTQYCRLRWGPLIVNPLYSQQLKPELCFQREGFCVLCVVWAPTHAVPATCFEFAAQRQPWNHCCEKCHLSHRVAWWWALSFLRFCRPRKALDDRSFQTWRNWSPSLKTHIKDWCFTL